MPVSQSTPASLRPPRGRRARPGPAGLVPVVIVVAISVLAYIGLSVVLAPPDAVDQYGTRLPYNFKSERGSITLLSSSMLLLAACLAGRALMMVRAERGRTRVLWTALTAIMTYFSVDEVGHFHEGVGDFLDGHFSTGPFRTYNDLVVISYGVLVLPLAFLLWREVLRHPRLLPMLAVTGALYVATTGVDTLLKDTTFSSEIIEEGTKVTCSSFFALSMLTGLVAVRWLRSGAGAGAGGGEDGGPATGGGSPALGATVIWLAIVGLMAVIGLLVLLVSAGDVRVLLAWLATVPAAVLIISVLPQLERRT